jgi:Na+/H+ antiporter NhaD/arsenite permease-like protein
MGIVVVLILVLFPIVFLFDTRLAAAALLVAIVYLYTSRAGSARKAPGKAVVKEKPWQDPWGTSGPGS